MKSIFTMFVFQRILVHSLTILRVRSLEGDLSIWSLSNNNTTTHGTESRLINWSGFESV